MAQEPPGGIRGFFRSWPGRIVLIAAIIGIVFGTYSYVSPILAIPVFLIVGLALPIYLGLKRPLFLAVAGLVVIVVVAPLTTIVFTQELLAPPGSASTAGAEPYEVNGSVLQNATISPFTGSAGDVYSWSVTIWPKFLNDSMFKGTNWSANRIELFVSTCPGATAPDLAYCGGSYTLITKNVTFSALHPPSNGSVVTFNATVGSNGIWAWQMELLLQNTSNASNPFKFELVGDPTYDGLEGPIVGGFGVVYVAVIGTVYEIDLIYLGIPFYFILLLYMWFKSREVRRKELVRRAQSLPPPGGGPGTPGTPQAPSSDAAPGPPGSGGGSVGGPRSPVASELACPNCSAVVYPKETKCWKCGATLPSTPAGSSPLPSGPP